MSVNIEEITFGVEIETIIPRGSVVRGSHGRGQQVRWLPAGWLADADPSLRTDHPQMFGCEFVSPVLKGRAGIQSVIHAIEEIKTRGGQVNNSCGFHVHVGFVKTDRSAVDRLVSIVANFEDAIYAQTGQAERKDGRWCKSLARQGNLRAALSQTAGSRYNVLNLQTGGKPTVEFRAFSATLDPLKAIGHILTCLGLCEKALSKPRKTKFTAKTPKETSPIHRGGAGQTALCRMFYFLGWTKGRESRTWGDLFFDPSQVKAVKKLLMGSAKTFDTPRRITDPPQRSVVGTANCPTLCETNNGTVFVARSIPSVRRRRLRLAPPPFVVIPSRRPTPDATPHTPAPQTSAGATPATPATMPRREPGEALLQMLRAVNPTNQNETPQ